ncbi:MAG: universal stress protein [Magnetococcus sp. DMHC-1]|nr:universal stress protein [Magnetococcales bacterium]
MSASTLLPTGRFQKILVATDGSNFSEGALHVAIALAKVTGATLYPMRMVISNPEIDTLVPDLAHSKEVTARKDLETIAQKMTTEAIAAIPVVKRGIHPHAEILAASEEIQADLIVMGRRGIRGLARLMVGEATARVVAQSRCKVLVVPKDAHLWQKGILLAVDGSRYSDRAAVTAGKLATLFQIPLTVVSVVRNVHGEKRRQEATEAMQRICLALEQDEPGIQVSGDVVNGDSTAQVIVQAASDRGADLIIGGSHGRSGLERVFLGSVMERIIGLAKVPILTVKGG